MHPIVAAAVAALVFLAVAGYAFQQKKMFLAESQIRVEPSQPKLLNDGIQPLFDPLKYDAFMDQEINAAEQIDLLTSALLTLPPVTWQQYGPFPAVAALNLRTQLKLARIRTSYLMSIGLLGSDPVKTAAIVNAVTTTFLEAEHKESLAQAGERTQLLGDERLRIEKSLRAARAEQIALSSKLGGANQSVAGSSPYDLELAGLRTNLSAAREAHDLAAAQLSSLTPAGPARSPGMTAAADEIIASDAGLASMKSTISQRRAFLAGQMAGMTPSNPIYKQDQDEIAGLDRSLETMTSELREKAARRLQDKLRSDLERTGDLESRLNGQLAQQIARASGAAPRLQRADEVAADIRRLEKRQADVDDAINSLQLAANGPGMVRLALPAEVPHTPEANRRKLFLLLSIPLALLLGTIAAIVARKRDPRVYNAFDIEEVLGFAPIAVLPARQDVFDNVFEEYVLRLAAGVESAHRTGDARTFLLSAASPSTAITSLSAALTRSLHQIGVTVIAATAAEMLRPAGTQASTSISDEDALVSRGRMLESGGESFVAANLARLKSEPGLILIEAHPLTNSAQTEYVARCADVSVLVIESGVTTREELLDAASLLERLNVTGIGAVLVEVRARLADRSFRMGLEAVARRQGNAERPARGSARTPESDATIPTELETVSHSDVGPAVTQLEILHDVAHDAHSLPDADLKSWSTARPEPIESEPPEKLQLDSYDHERSALSTQQLNDVPPQPAITETLHEEPSVVALFDGTTPVAPIAATVKLEPLTALEPSLLEAPVEKMAEIDVPIAVVPTVSHEKMAPQVSPGLAKRVSDGDGTMTRRGSWLSRLLGRNDEPEFNIFSKVYEEKAPKSASSSEVVHVVSPVSEFDLAPEPFDTAPHATDSATRLTQPVMLHEPDEAQPLEFATQVHQAVRDEPTIDAPGFVEMVHAVEIPREQAHSSEVAHDLLEETAEPEYATRLHQITPLEPQAAAQAEPISAVSVTQILVESAPPEDAPVFEHVVVDHADESPREQEVVPMEAALLPELAEQELQPIHPVESGVPALLPTPAESEPATPRLRVRPRSFFELAALSPAVAADPVEPFAPQPHSRISRPLPAQVAAIQAPWALVAPTLAARPVDPVHETPRESVGVTPTDDPYDRNGQYDVEPNPPAAGRWDPIPPLRPSAVKWRDRPSPIPESAPPRAGASSSGAERRRWTGVEDDGLSAVPPARWVPQRPVAAAPEVVESVSEPLLTRQWGLLSRFQQARISTAERARVDSASDTDQQREAVGPGSPSGSRQG